MMKLDDLQKKALVDSAACIREKAYSPYSDFCVGAALLCADGEIFAGVNIENSSYGGTICAERSAFCAAISEGKRDFVAIAIVGGKRGEDISGICPPCGICRQFMSEFCTPDLQVLLYDGQAVVESTLGALLPEAFKL
jgi:cytidine deaminase